jgi:hypothetical protein
MSAVLTLAAASAWGQATPTFKPVFSVDFSQVSPNNPTVTINGYGAVTKTAFQGSGVPNPTKQALRFTDAGNEVTSFFIPTPMALSNYQVEFDFQVQPPTPTATGSAIADGFAFVAQNHSDSSIGGGGGSIGYLGTLSESGYSYAVDFNTYPPNGIPAVGSAAAVPEIVSLDLGFPYSSGSARTKLFPTALALVGQGVIHAAIRVTPDQIVGTFTGGKIPASTPVVMQTLPITGLFAPLGADGKPLPLYFGMSGATGGSSMVLDVFDFTLEVPSS